MGYYKNDIDYYNVYSLGYIRYLPWSRKIIRCIYICIILFSMQKQEKITILTRRSDIGNKAKNIISLHKKKYLIPRTIICDVWNLDIVIKQIKNTNIEKFFIRPSFQWEDSKYESLAWNFHSIWPYNLSQLTEFLLQSKNEILQQFWWNTYTLWSIIIQDFIDTNSYGVLFTRDPQNLLLAWDYEIWGDHDHITSGKITGKSTHSYFLRRKLFSLGTKIESDFWFPQDIEFAITWRDIIILQTRNITSWDISLPCYRELESITWVYHNINNGEFWEVSYFSASLLSYLFSIIHIWWSIYARKLRKNLDTPKELQNFVEKYKTYLQKKLIYSVLQKILFFQKLDKAVLQKFYKDYTYSFDLWTKSVVKDAFHYQTNTKTKLLIKSEKYKSIAFKQLETFKEKIVKENTLWNDINYLSYDQWLNGGNKLQDIISQRKHVNQIYNYDFPYIIIIWGKIMRINKAHTRSDKKWIYKWELQGKHITKDTLNYNTNKQVLLIDNLSEDITKYLWYISWVVAQGWSIYSHNAILLREWKIPSYIINSEYK